MAESQVKRFKMTLEAKKKEKKEEEKKPKGTECMSYKLLKFLPMLFQRKMLNTASLRSLFMEISCTHPYHHLTAEEVAAVIIRSGVGFYGPTQY